MNRLPTNETKRPIALRLPQISLKELKTLRVAIRRKDVPLVEDNAEPLLRNLDDPTALVLHRPGEGQYPIFDREDIIVNLDFDERIVVATATLKAAEAEERQNSNSRTRNRRSRSNSPQRSLNRDYYSRPRSRSNDRIGQTSGTCVKEDSRNKSNSTFRRTVGEHSNRTDKSDAYDSETEPSTSAKNRRRSLSKERRRSSSRDREYSKLYRRKSPRPESYRSRHYESERRHRTPSPDYRQRKYSRSPTYKRETTHRSYNKSQERRSRSPYRDRDPSYRKRSRSPYMRERYKSPGRKEHRKYSRSPPRYRHLLEEQRRPMPPYQIPPNFAPPWPIYEPMPPYVRFMVPEGYMHAPPPRIPGNLMMGPRMPPRQLPIYNKRPIPKLVKDSDSNAPTSTVNISTPNSTPSSSNTPTATVTANTPQETKNKPDSVEFTGQDLQVSSVK